MRGEGGPMLCKTLVSVFIFYYFLLFFIIFLYPIARRPGMYKAHAQLQE